MKAYAPVLLVCAVAISVFAQANATVGGTVSDSSGALIPGVRIVAVNVNTGVSLSVVTNESGSYQFASLQPGIYRLSAGLAGFATKTYDKVELSQSQQVRLNFQLELAKVDQAVEVRIEADTVLGTTTASVGTVIRVDQVNLPLQTRNIMDLAANTPGAIATGANNANTTFAGTRSSQVNTTRDGLVVSDGRYMDWNGAFAATYTTPDLVEEVQITTNTIDAEVGRGSGQVRLQTRSGGNQFHGAVFYTNNNSALNAMNFFDNLVGATKPYTNRNQFGGRIGGPIKQNKAFFFFLYEGQRYLRKEEFISNVLTPTARQGIFRFLTANATGAGGGTSRRNGNAFATTPSVDLQGNVLTSDNGVPLFLNSINLFSQVNDPNRTRIDPVWVTPQLLQRMPLPNDYRVGDGLNTAGFRWLRPIKGSEDATGVTNNSNRNQYNARVDYQINDRHKLFGTFSREKDTGLTGQAGIASYPNGFNGVVERRPDIYTVALTSIVSSSLLNEFRWGLRRTSFYGWSPIHLGCCSGSSDTDIDDVAQQAVATFPSNNGYLLNLTSSLPFVGGAAGNTTLGSPIAPHGTGATRGSNSPLWSFADTMSWTKGRHSFKFGTELIFANSDGWNTGNTDLYPRATLGEGSVAIQGITTALFPGLNAADVTPAKDLMSTLAGTVSEITQGFIINSPTATSFDDYKVTIRRQRDIHQNDWSLFFKDSWKVSDSVTLNLGLRYDKYGVPWEASGLAGRASGGQAGLFGSAGRDFSALWNPFATGGSPTTFELIGKNSPNPGVQAYKDDWNNFAPSVGFSWQMPWSRRPLILRGGYGINYTGGATFLTYDTTTLASIPGTDNLRTVSPATYTDLTTVALPLTPTSAPLAPIPTSALNVDFAAYDDNRVIPYVQNYTLSVQYELSRNLTLDVSYSGTKGTKLWSPIQLNEVNIFENGILDAFNTTRAGGNAELFNRMLMNLNVPGVGIVNGTTLTGSEALRRFTTTNIWLANGEVGALANYINTTTAIGGSKLAMLRNAGLPENYIVVNPQFRSLGLHGNNDNSTYHSLVTQIRKRFSHGVTAEFAHTWSRAIGNTAIPAGVGTDTTLTARDHRNRSLQKGLETFHRRHTINAFGAWDLPFGQNRLLLTSASGFLEQLVGGWQMSGIFNWSTGAPIGFNAGNGTNSATVFRQTLGAQNSINTADLVGELGDFGEVEVRDGYVEYFENLKTRIAPLPNFGGNTTLAGRFTNQVVVDNNGNIVLQNPGPGTTGSTGQRWFEGPANFRMDAALSKKFAIDEARSITIRADAVNVLNSPIWGN
ncbi:MAG TPA: TonB-dependent receptor, partial [Terriglobia bacterium]|nr:TonB-dependent receptor [Terriglobia bacterium]